MEHLRTPPLVPFTICVLPLLIVLTHTLRGLVLAFRALRSSNAAERFHRNTHCSLHLQAWDPQGPEREAALVAARELCCATWAWAVTANARTPESASLQQSCWGALGFVGPPPLAPKLLLLLLDSRYRS